MSIANIRVYHITFGLKLVTAAAMATAVAGCASSHPKEASPVVVQVSEEPAQGGRFRAPERQRDVWIAPQAVDNEILRHEQVVTFVERPSSWQLPSAIEPNAIPEPSLTREVGQYDAEPMRRQREIIADTQEQLRQLAATMEGMKKQASDQIDTRERHLTELSTQLQNAQRDLAAAQQKLAEIEAAEQLKKAQEKAPPAPAYQWWRLW